MSELTSYAIIGSGVLGNAFIKTLLASSPTVSITILTRSATKSSTLPSELTGSSQIKTALVDYTSVASVSAAMKEHNVEVVVDTIPVYVAAFHYVLVDAAKEAGTVKLFVPSEFGFVTEGGDASPLSQRVDVQHRLKEVGLPFVVIQVGLFTEWISTIAQTESGKFLLVGSGGTPFSATSVQDIAGFLVHLLRNHSVAELAFTFYRLQGSRLTMKEAAAKFGLPVEFVDVVPASADQESYALTGLQKILESGKGSTGWDCAKGADDESLAGSGNKHWEGHVWRAVEDVHGL